MYCFHGLVVTIAIKLIAYFEIVNNGILSLLAYPLMMFFLTLVLSALSFKYFERIFLVLKEKIK